MSITTEQLMSMLSIDNVEASTTSDRIVLIQRDPQPGEINISLSSPVRFMIADLDGDPKDPGASTLEFTLKIEGAVAGEYTSGVFTLTSPWLGSVTPIHPSGKFVGWDVEVYQSTDYLISEQVVDIEIDVSIAGGFGTGAYGHFAYGTSPVSPTTSTFNYSFIAEDKTQPNILSANAISEKTVQVVFDDNMSVDGASSVLLPENWSVETHNIDPLPGAFLTVISVETVPGSDNKIFYVNFNWESTRNCEYKLIANSAIADDSGNLIDYDNAFFTGYAYELKEGRVFSIWDLIPQKNKDEDLTFDLVRYINCFDEVLGLLFLSIDNFTNQIDFDLCTIEDIDNMLYDLGNPFTWSELELTDSQKYKLVASLVSIYQLKGTNKGIEDTIFFLLGESVTVVDYTQNGWILGVDQLGNGSFAEVVSGVEPYDFSGSPLTLELEISGVPQIITFELANFTTPASAMSTEVVTVLQSQLVNSGAYKIKDGTPATLLSGNAEHFNLSGSETLLIEVNGTDNETIVFRSDDIATAGSASSEEVARRINIDSTLLRASVYENKVKIETIKKGEASSIKVIGGTANAVLSFSTTITYGTNDAQVSIYSKEVGKGATVEITGGTAIDILGFDTIKKGGTGGAILAPSDQKTIYSFDIETANEVDDDTKKLIRLIAEYMKVAHEHLVNIRTAKQLIREPGWILGVSRLNVDTELTE